MYVLCVLYSKYKYGKSTKRKQEKDFRKKIPVDRIFSGPFQTGPGAHPASYKMGTGSFTGVKRPGRGVNHPPHLALRLRKD